MGDFVQKRSNSLCGQILYKSCPWKKEDQIFSFSWCNDYCFLFHSFFFKMDFWNFGIVQCTINVRLQRDNSPASPLGVI